MAGDDAENIPVSLSYRRDDCAAHAGRLADNLQGRGIADIDVEGIQLGESFLDRSDSEVGRCDAMVAMIGDDWLTLEGSDGGQQINDPNDWVTLEIASALRRGIPRIPVLVEGASMLQETDLPGPIGENEAAIIDWLRRKGHMLPNFWRVLGSDDEVNDDWACSEPNVHATADEIRSRIFKGGLITDGEGRGAGRAKWTVEDGADAGAWVSALEEQGSAADDQTDTLIVAGRKAYPDYLLSNSYICQAGRSLRRGIERLGCYAERQIKREIPQVLHRRDDVIFSLKAAAQIRERGGPFDQELATLVVRALDQSEPWQIEREYGEAQQVFLLTTRTLMRRCAFRRRSITEGDRHGPRVSTSRGSTLSGAYVTPICSSPGSAAQRSPSGAGPSA